MKFRTPIITLAIAAALACMPAWAANPVNTTAPSAYPNASALTQDAGNSRIVAIVRKVYFFDTLDRNHNGMLTRSELPADMSNLRRNFMRADFDGNGQLSRSEILLYERGQAPQYIGVDHAVVFVFQGGHRAENLSMAK